MKISQELNEALSFKQTIQDFQKLPPPHTLQLRLSTKRLVIRPLERVFRVIQSTKDRSCWGKLRTLNAPGGVKKISC